MLCNEIKSLNKGKVRSKRTRLIQWEDKSVNLNESSLQMTGLNCLAKHLTKNLSGEAFD